MRNQLNNLINIKLKVYPYEICLKEIEQQDGNKLSPKENYFCIFIYEQTITFVGKYANGIDVSGDIKEIPELAGLVDDIHKITKAKLKQRRPLLYDLLVDILESMEYGTPLPELRYAISNNHVLWLIQAKRYYYSAQILQRNYNAIMSKKLKKRSKKHTKNCEEAFATDMPVIYLYSRALECILKSRIYYKFETAQYYLQEKKRIKEKRALKKWMQNNINIHDMNKLAQLAGCRCRKKSDRYEYDQITELLESGKYPSLKKSDFIHDYIISGVFNDDMCKKKEKLSKKEISNEISGEEMFTHFDKIVLSALERCYGYEFRRRFNEWHRSKILALMTGSGINYNKEVRQRNALIKEAIGNKRV